MANKELINWARGEANRLKTAGPPTNSGLQATAMARRVSPITLLEVPSRQMPTGSRT